MSNCECIILYAGLENEGAIDPWQLLSAIREKNITLGVQYVKGDVEGFVFTRPQGFQDTHGCVPDEDADAANYRLRRMTGVIVSQIRFICSAKCSSVSGSSANGRCFAETYSRLYHCECRGTVGGPSSSNGWHWQRQGVAVYTYSCRTEASCNFSVISERWR